MVQGSLDCWGSVVRDRPSGCDWSNSNEYMTTKLASGVGTGQTNLVGAERGMSSKARSSNVLIHSLSVNVLYLRPFRTVLNPRSFCTVMLKADQ